MTVAEAEPAPLTSPVALEVDENDANGSDADSFLETNEGSSTSSINSSILRYRQENGRTYHAYKDGQYVMPNDEREQDRLDLQHHLFLITFDNKLYLSPAGRNGHQVQNVLDVGTGTGLWAMDFADENPSASITLKRTTSDLLRTVYTPILKPYYCEGYCTLRSIEGSLNIRDRGVDERINDNKSSGRRFFSY